MPTQSGPSVELRRAYDALIELNVLAGAVSQKVIEEFKEFYLSAFQAFNRGEMQDAELLARAARHLCHAAWSDAKIKYLEGHADDVPHVPGLNADSASAFDERFAEIQSRLARLKLTGVADRFGQRTRNHLRCLEALANKNTLLAEAFLRAAYEYCLATEAFQQLEYRIGVFAA